MGTGNFWSFLNKITLCRCSKDLFRYQDKLSLCYLQFTYLQVMAGRGVLLSRVWKMSPCFRTEVISTLRVAESGVWRWGAPSGLLWAPGGAILGHVSKPGVTLYLRGCVHPAKANLCLGNILSYRSPVTLKENKNSLKVLNGNIFLPNNVQIMLHDII